MLCDRRRETFHFSRVGIEILEVSLGNRSYAVSRCDAMDRREFPVGPNAVHYFPVHLGIPARSTAVALRIILSSEIVVPSHLALDVRVHVALDFRQEHIVLVSKGVVSVCGRL